MLHIVDYNAGNLTSVKRALDYLGIPSLITADSKKIRGAERIIFPGVGHASAAMAVLRARRLDSALRDAFAAGTPMLGICLGTQIVLSHSDEGDTACLGLIEGNCPRFAPADAALKVPHMGWNAVRIVRPHPVLGGVRDEDEFYFVHSFFPRPRDASHVFAETGYGAGFPSAIGSGNLFATQFHPEKSGRIGLEILKNFTAWDGDGC